MLGGPRSCAICPLAWPATNQLSLGCEVLTKEHRRTGTESTPLLLIFLVMAVFLFVLQCWGQDEHKRAVSYKRGVGGGDHPSCLGRGEAPGFQLRTSSQRSCLLSCVIFLLCLFPSPDHSHERPLGFSHPPSSHCEGTRSLCETASHREHSGPGNIAQVGFCPLPEPLLLGVC